MRSTFLACAILLCSATFHAQECPAGTSHIKRDYGSYCDATLDLTPSPVGCTQPPTQLEKTRSFKYGKDEALLFQDLQKASGAQKISIAKQFRSQYPDSDFIQSILFSETTEEYNLGDWQAASVTANSLIEASDNVTMMLIGYTYLVDSSRMLMVPGVTGDALLPIAKGIRCGRQILLTYDSTDDAKRNLIAASAYIFHSTAGQLAVQYGHFGDARSEFEAAAKILADKSNTAIRSSNERKLYISLADATLSMQEDSSFPSGLFYLARACNLAPQDEQLSSILTNLYESWHGSASGLDKLLAQSSRMPFPPNGFSIKKKKDSTVKKRDVVLGAAVIALLTYAAIRGGGVVSQPDERSNGKLMLFGGIDHRTYLGCLSCRSDSMESVQNSVSKYGNGYSSESIWNHMSPYGSDSSAYSACNSDADDPPVIVDDRGTFYGRLTTNRSHQQLRIGAQFIDWLANTVCVR